MPVVEGLKNVKDFMIKSIVLANSKILVRFTYRLTEDSSVATQTCSMSDVRHKRNTGAEASHSNVRCSGSLRSVIHTLRSRPDDNTVLKASLV